MGGRMASEIENVSAEGDSLASQEESIASVRSWLEASMQSRFTLPALVILTPVLVLLLYPNVLVPSSYEVDPWLYISWARHFEYVTDRWYFTYYFVRFGVTVPGNLLNVLLPDFAAQVAWGLFFNTIFLASVAGVLRRLFGPTYAVLGLVFVATDLAMQNRMSYGYVTGPSTAYLAATFYFTVRAANDIPGPSLRPAAVSSWRGGRVAVCLGSFFMAGLTFSLSVLTYFNTLFWALPLVVAFLLLCRHYDFRVIGVGMALIAAAGALVVASHVFIFYHFTGRYDFWLAPLEFTKQDAGAFALPFSQFTDGF